MGQYLGYNNDDIIEAVKTSENLSQVLGKLNLVKAGGNFDNLKRNIAILELDTSHFTGRVWSRDKTLKDWAEYKRNTGRKKILIKEKGYKCEICNLSEWQNEKIPLELHHINGIRLDNSRENLQLLCCNCHGLTSNWRARNKGSVVKLVNTTDLYKLSNYYENNGLNPVKVGETLTDEADGNPEPSLRKKKGVESGRREPKSCKCGNSITQQSTYCIDCYNIKKRSNIPKVPDILKAFEDKKSYVQVGKYFGVSDNAVRKWVESYGLQDMVKGHSSAQNENVEKFIV